MRRNNKAVVTLAALSALVLAGNASAQQGVTDTQILLGTHLDLSGPVAAGMPYLRNGMLMKIDEINAKGGIHGRKLKLIIEDNGYQPAKGVRAVLKLVKKDKVFAIVSPFGTLPTIAGHGASLKAGVPHLFPWSGVSAPFHKTKSPLSFTFVANYDWGTAVGVSWAVKNLKPKKVGVLYQDDAYGKLVLKGTAEALAVHNMKIAAKAGFKAGSVDLSSQLASLRRAGVDLVVLGSIIRETIAAYAGAKKMGWQVKMLTTVAGRNQIVTAIARKAKVDLTGLYGVGQWKIHGPKTDSAAARAWMGAYIKKYKKPPTVESMVAYSLIEWTAMGLEKSGRGLTTAKFVAAMRSIKYTDKFGNPTIGLANGNHAEPQAVGIDMVKGGFWTRITPVLTSVK